MVFQNMEHYLKILGSKEEISAEQVLGGFQELCRDVTKAGKNVAYHDIEDMPAFLELLFWTGNLYCRLYEKKKDEIRGYDEAEDVGAGAERAGREGAAGPGGEGGRGV